jgi:DNA polymerase phi
VKEAELRRQLLGDYLLNIVRKVNFADESREPTYIKDVALPTIAKFAYSIDSNCQPQLSEKTRTLFRNRLLSAFSHLLSDLRGYSYPCDLVLSLSPDAVDMDDEISAAKDSALSTMGKILKKIRKSEKKSDIQSKAPLQALALLYSLSVFQLYNGEAEAASILEELKICYDKLIRHKDSEDTEASEVLVELLLSFVSKPSALLRKVTSHVFGAFMSNMTAGGLKLMTDVLESDESLRGQQSLFDQESENENGEDEDESDSDVEVVDMNGEEGKFKVHTEEEQLEDDEDELNVDEEKEEQSEEDEDAKKLDEALAQALGTHRLDQDAEAESDSDADMTDSEMMALDSKLVEIFSQRKKVPNKKQEQKDAKETVVNFKSRVLDLLDIYVKKQASNSLAFGLLLPLLQLARTTKTKPLSEKAHNIIIAFAKASKGVKKEDLAEVNVDEMLELMRDIHLEASKDPSHVFAKAASTASLLVSSRLFRVDRNNGRKIVAVYADSQGSVLEGNVKIQAAVFHEFTNWVQSHIEIFRYK